MAEAKQNVFGRAANTVDRFFSTKYYRVGNFVGSRPFTTIGVTFAFVLLCVGGMSQLKSESRSEKLWIPQGTVAQDDSEVYEKHFPSAARVEDIIIEAKSGSVLQKDALLSAMALHEKIEKVSYSGKNLSSLCVGQNMDGHPCLIQSVLGTWNYTAATLMADADPLAAINKRGLSQHDLNRMLGGAAFSNGKLVSAPAMRITYLIKSNRKRDGGGWADDIGEGYEEKLLELMGCLDLKCKGKGCTCDYSDKYIRVYPSTQRSFSDAFGSVIRGDVNLTMASYFLMILYMVINLGNVCHKIKARSLLAVSAVLCIVIAGASGYGLAAWMQFKYTPVHSVLPFVLLGIGVDDSFVIVNALDHTDAADSVPTRIAQAISKAGVSVMVTSLTDFVAFAISVSSALPALSSFCMYAAFAILMMFVIQLTVFTAFATLDTRRIASNRIDCLPCLARGCACCPTVPQQEASAAVGRGEKDPNQLCCKPSQHTGGYLGWFLENKFAATLVRKPVAAGAILFCFAFCGLCVWQTTLLSVQDTQRNFIPDNTYVATTLNKNDKYFGELGQSVWIVTLSGDYFKSQAALADIGTRLGKLDYMQPTTGQAFVSWAESFKKAVTSGTVGMTVAHTGGILTSKTAYYAAVDTWLKGSGSAYRKDVKWVDDADPQKGIKASRISAEYKPITEYKNDKLITDSDKAVKIMDDLRDVVEGWSDMPGTSFAYSRQFLSWETFRIIKKELYMSLGLCLGAVLIITLVLIAHPLTALLVFLCVVMVVVDILGCLNMWGLAIDNVSVIQLVISVGLCVDYAAHVGHSFMTHEGTRPERVVATLGDVGVAVLNGGFSTFLATVLLAMSQSYVFRVLFISFFLTVLIGMFHGMILLPSLLSLIGPASYGGQGEAREAEEKKPDEAVEVVDS